MIKALLIDNDRVHAERLEQELNRRGLTTIYVASSREALKQLENRAGSIDLVVLAIADLRQPWLEILHQLQQASWRAGIGEFPLFLCISRPSLRAEFQLQIERMGARHVIE